MEKKKVVKKEKKVEAKVKEPVFAVVEASGSQFKVLEGKKYELDHMEGEKGAKIELDKVLLIADGDKVLVGKPYVEKAKVLATIDSQKKDEKIRGLVFKAKSRYRKHYGHRAKITRVLIEKISV